MSGSLDINRWRVDCLSNGLPERAAALRTEIDRALASDLPAACRMALSQLCDRPDDERVIVIDRLNLQLASNIAITAAALAEALAAALAAAVARTSLASATDRAVVYRTRADREARLIAALASGAAWHGPLFADRDGLRALPPGVAIRTLTEADPQLALAAWILLSPEERAAAVPTLDAVDAMRTLAALAGAEPGDADSEALALIAEAAAALPAEAGTRGALLRVLAARCALQAPGIGSLAAADSLLVELAELPQAARALLAEGRFGEFMVSTGTIAPSHMALLASLPAELVASLAGQPGHGAAPSALPAWSPHAGLLMLVPWIAVPAGLDGDCGNMLVRLVLAAIGGDEGCEAIFADEGLARALPVDPRLEFAQLASAIDAVLADTAPCTDDCFTLPARWAEAHRLPRTARLARHALDAFCTRLVGFDRSSPAFLLANLIGGGGTIESMPDFLRVRIDRPPLDVLLSISGLANRSAMLPDGRSLVLERGA